MSELRTNRIVPRDGLVSTTTSAGGIIQVKHTIFTGIASRATSGNNFGALVTSDAITPTRSDSKILIQCVMHMASSNSSGRFGYRVMRIVGGSASHISPQQYGDGDGNRTQVATYHRQSSGSDMPPLTFTGIDAPSTTSAVTYSIYSSGESSDTVYLNRTYDNTDSANHYRPISAITLMEVSG